MPSRPARCRRACRGRRRSLLVRRGLLARRRRAHRGGRPRSARRRPTDGSHRSSTADGTDAPTTPPTPVTTDDSTGRRPTDDAASRRARSTGSSSTTQLEHGAARGARSTTTTPTAGTFELFLVRHRADRPGRPGSARCSSTPAGPGFGGSSLAAAAELRLRRGAARALRHRRLGPARHRATRRRRSTASTTTTSTSPAPTSRPTTTPSASRSSTSPSDFEEQCVDEERRHPPAHRHERLGPRHGLDPPGARRGRDLLLRVQLRQRARRDVGDAVPRHRAGRRARRCRRPDGRADRGRPAAGRRASRTPLDDVPGRLQRRRRVRVPQRRRRRGRVRRADAGARRGAGPERARPARRHAGRGAAGGAPARCTSDGSWNQLSEALAAAQDGDGEGLLAPVGHVLPAPARRHVAEPARGVPDDPLHGRDRTPDGRGGRRRSAPEFQEVAPRMSPGTTGSYFCTFYPPPESPRVADHGRRRRADRRRRHDR